MKVCHCNTTQVLWENGQYALIECLFGCGSLTLERLNTDGSSTVINDLSFVFDDFAHRDDELAWLRWFHDNADDNVGFEATRSDLMKLYIEQTGNPIPAQYRAGYLPDEPSADYQGQHCDVCKKPFTNADWDDRHDGDGVVYHAECCPACN